jgi:hypothetical protein
MARPLADAAAAGPATSARYPWLTVPLLARIRAFLFGLTLFVGLVVWVFHSLGSLGPERAETLPWLAKLRGLGVMTWLYALFQMLDMRFYNSRFARRRREATGIPDSLHGWLFGQMLAWFGIVYYGLTEDPTWYAAGLVIFALSFLAFPIRRRD